MRQTGGARLWLNRWPSRDNKARIHLLCKLAISAAYSPLVIIPISCYNSGLVDRVVLVYNGELLYSFASMGLPYDACLDVSTCGKPTKSLATLQRMCVFSVYISVCYLDSVVCWRSVFIPASTDGRWILGLCKHQLEICDTNLVSTEITCCTDVTSCTCFIGLEL